MKKVLGVSGLIAIFALVVLLVVGSVGAEEEDPSGTATRINFEVSGDVAKEGLYIV